MFPWKSIIVVKIIFLQARIYLKLQIYGSILGPFVSVVIYANDLANVLEFCQVTLFADDTVLYCSYKSTEDLQQKFITDLARVCDWLKMNHLTIIILRNPNVCFRV